MGNHLLPLISKSFQPCVLRVITGLLRAGVGVCMSISSPTYDSVRTHCQCSMCDSRLCECRCEPRLSEQIKLLET